MAKIRISVDIENDLLERFEAQQRRLSIRQKSELVRALLSRGLEVYEADAPVGQPLPTPAQSAESAA